MPLYTPGLANPMTTGGDIIYGGASGVPTRLANGSNGQFLTSSGGTTAPTWTTASASSAAFNITAQTSNYTASTNDFILASTGAFTVTLPTAVGNSGKTIVIQKTDTPVGNIVTLNTTSAQTIGGIASGTYKLITFGETLTVVSDNANWRIQEHYSQTSWTNQTTSWTGSTSNPTVGTMTTDSLLWRRNGTDMEYIINFNQASGGANGSGDYLLAFPSGIVSTLITTNATVYGNANQVGGTVIGSGNMVQGGTARGPISIYCGSTSTFKFWIEGSQVWNSGGAGFSGAVFFSGFGKVPISTWQP